MTGNPEAGVRIQSGGEAAPARSETERDADLAAVRRCLSGDRAAFGGIVARWQDRIYGAVYRMTGDAEDARELAQETFLRAWASLRTYEGGAAFGTWLYSIALNQVRSEMRRRSAQKRGNPVSLESSQDREGQGIDPESGAASPEDRACAQEEVALLRRAVAALDEDSREVIVLREYQDLSYEEIAAAVGIPVGTVRSRLFRAREELRRRLQGKVG